MSKESYHQGKAIREMRDLGWKVWKQEPYTRDTIDLVVMTTAGKVYFLEWKKSPKEQMTDNQMTTVAWLVHNGHNAGVVNPYSWELVLSVMKDSEPFFSFGNRDPKEFLERVKTMS